MRCYFTVFWKGSQPLEILPLFLTFGLMGPAPTTALCLGNSVSSSSATGGVLVCSHFFSFHVLAFLFSYYYYYYFFFLLLSSGIFILPPAATSSSRLPSVSSSPMPLSLFCSAFFFSLHLSFHAIPDNNNSRGNNPQQ